MSTMQTSKIEVTFMGEKEKKTNSQNRFTTQQDNLKHSTEHQRYRNII
jgi:hypothetical protein